MAVSAWRGGGEAQQTQHNDDGSVVASRSRHHGSAGRKQFREKFALKI
jgi:hypothetical protein